MTTAITKKNTGKRVGTKHVDQLISTYKKERWMANSRAIGKADALSTWYGLDQMSAFLELAREHKADGIKIYYGVYPETMDVPEELHGRQTVVLVATKTTITGYDITINKDIYVDSNGRPEILGFNFGNTCPPWCGTGEPPPGSDSPYELDGISISMEKIGLTIIEDKDKVIII